MSHEFQPSHIPVDPQKIDRFVQWQKETQEARDMALLSRIQAEFNAALNLPFDKKDMRDRSFNPVTDRWHVEMLRRDHDAEGLIAFRSEMRENHRTDLIERFHAVESHGEFLIKPDGLYSPKFPQMPFREVLKRGVQHRKEALESPEVEREGELGEAAGWDIMDKAFRDPDAKIGITFLSFSPKSMVEDGSYKGNFVDRNTLSLDDSENMYVKRIRFAVDWGINEYKSAALSLDPEYFKEYDGRPLDAWFLSHPLKGDKDLVPALAKGLSPDKFAAIYEDQDTQDMIGRYENLIYAENTDWVEVILLVNAIRNHTDKLKGEDANNEEVKIKSQFYVDGKRDEKKFQAYIYAQGVQPVAAVSGGGCPDNKGWSLNGVFAELAKMKIQTGMEIFSNSVAKFLKGEGEWFSCPKCSYKASGPIGDNPCPGCEFTKEQAVEEGFVPCD